MVGIRARWAAIGAAIATAIVVSFGLGGVLPFATALVGSGARPVFVSVAPTRVLDTRTNLGLAGKFLSGSPRPLQLTGSVLTPAGAAVVIPPGATGVVLNVTVVGATGAGFLSVRPDNPSSAPSTSNLNFEAGTVVPNAVTVSLSTAGTDAGKVQLWYQANSGSGTADVLVDVMGYYDDHNHDDLYYRKSVVDDKIADGPEVVVATDTFVSNPPPNPLRANELGLNDGFGLETKFTTTRTSRLRVEQSAAAYMNCSAFWFLSVDGVPVRSSIRDLLSSVDRQMVSLAGITELPIASGPHVMNFNAVCAVPTPLLSNGFSPYSTGLVTYIAG